VLVRHATQLALVLMLAMIPLSAMAQGAQPAVALNQDAAASRQAGEPIGPDWNTQVEQLQTALARLPVAAGLACVLALRPRRRGTPRRQPPVIQTQIILAIVGAVVMLVVGTSLARAFGIVGAAGLVRYRAKIDDPKDAGVLLSTLAVGLAAGVGLWMLATFATAFILGVLWIIESFEPAVLQLFTLKVQARDATVLKTRIEDVLKRNRLEFELRVTAPEEICYEVRLPLDKNVDKLSSAILKLDPANTIGVEWDEKDKRKSG
jgi:uncharacterized membrane protein YhiD involved in acid resistance